MNIFHFSLTLTVSLLAGYGLYRIALKLVPIYLLSQPRLLAGNITKEAHKRHANLLKQKPSLKKLELEREKLYEEIRAHTEAVQHEAEAQQARKEELKQETQRMQRKEQHLEGLHARAQAASKLLESAHSDWKSSCAAVHNSLAQQCGQSSDQITRRLQHDYIHHHTLEYQKVTQFMESELSAQARKKADMILTNVHSRYSPDFAWPKMSNIITEPNQGDIESLLDKHGAMVDELREISGVEISTISDKSDDERIIAMKFAGGFGIHKEAAKHTFADWLAQRDGSFALQDIYTSHLRKLNEQARKLGRQAITNLGLHDIHPELQYLIGALNWRTSYRQNQWLHTMEVAVLAGIIAEELGEDPQAAKRSGLLHDVGKALDYRIEGSHAVISGDYADRFGESKLICDTVMSHHSDLVIENPLAFTLMAADTLSGARPGARVNIEEDYQLRLSSITDTVKSFAAVDQLNIMNGGREVHISVHHHKVSEQQAQELVKQIAAKIEADVLYPSQIKVQVSRMVQSQAVA